MCNLQPKKNFIFARNLTSNQPVDFSEYNEYYIADEILSPLAHLPKYFQQTCNINGNSRTKWIFSQIQHMENYIGKKINIISNSDIRDQYDIYLPNGEYTSLKNVNIINNQHEYGEFHTFTSFYTKVALPNHVPQYIPRTQGEKDCMAQLTQFLDNSSEIYETDRTKINSQYTSKLSPFFALGIISFEQIISEIQKKPIPEFIRQCYWILYCKLKVKNIIDQSLPLELNPEDIEKFHQWANGELPESNQVDRVINQYMKMLKMGELPSNRFRLMTCYYLVKILNIDWRYGEMYFRSALTDSHPLINYFNWKWQCTQNRFFRNYNLERQIKLHL